MGLSAFNAMRARLKAQNYNIVKEEPKTEEVKPVKTDAEKLKKKHKKEQE